MLECELFFGKKWICSVRSFLCIKQVFCSISHFQSSFKCFILQLTILVSVINFKHNLHACQSDQFVQLKISTLEIANNTYFKYILVFNFILPYYKFTLSVCIYYALF